MNKLLRVLVALVVLVGACGLGVAVYRTQQLDSSETVLVFFGDMVVIPKGTTHIGLLGCTPHPTTYLKTTQGSVNQLAYITGEDFLDMEYVLDSFVRTFTECNEQGIDLLVIAYLPIYYVGMRGILGNRFVEGCRTFLMAIAADMQHLIERAVAQTNYQGLVMLVLPPDYQLERVPAAIADQEDRCRYLVKQFPYLSGLSNSLVTHITIINNCPSPEDDALIRYFRYEYLFQAPVEFGKAYINKERFHKNRA